MRQSILDTHRQLLQKWRSKMDLIGPGNMERHFIDAISAIEDLPLSGKWIDLGSGAGFPGIALAALHPNIDVTLVESRHKRATFLKQVLLQGKISNATVLCTRTEDITDIFDGVISRAYKPPLEFLHDATQLTHPQGQAICMLGEDAFFDLPKDWQLLDEKIYPISEIEGNRKRWLLQRKI